MTAICSVVAVGSVVVGSPGGFIGAMGVGLLFGGLAFIVIVGGRKP